MRRPANHGYKQLNYSALPYLMLQAIRELKQENDSLREQITSQNERLERIEQTLHSVRQ
jgi:hypothetical protein